MKPQILIVDDRSENLYAMARVLQKLDVEIIQATSGAQALQMALEHDFFAAIVDVQMPEMDGYELVELLRGNEATETLPVIFVSAIFSDEYHHRKGYDVGAVDFMSKPFAPEILLSKVKVFLDLYEQRARLQEMVAELDKVAMHNAQLYAQVVRFNQELEDKVKQRTAELDKAYQKLSHLDKNKSDFIQVAAHELRTPLTLIKGYTQLLEGLISSHPQSQELVQGILAGHDRLHEVVNSMLDISRLNVEVLAVCDKPIQLAQIMSHSVGSLEAALKERCLSLTVDDMESLPTIEADPDLIQKVFYHLIVNAIKYTPDGKAITVSGQTLPGSDQQAYVEIIVSDTGIGIDPEYHELIFEKFYQTGQVAFHSSGKTKFKGGGAGLGLAIAKGIVEAHGGRIWVESPGYDEEACPGSQFHVILPTKQPQARSSQAQTPSSDAPTN